MLTRGNSKLGPTSIWGFGLPSGDPNVCVGMTALCSKFCYAKRIEQIRSVVRTAYLRNLEATKQDDFVDRMIGFIINNNVKIIRVHTAGEFYSADYVDKWWQISSKLNRVRFYAYTRSWVVPSIRPSLIKLAKRHNWQLWYSADKDTGLPKKVPSFVRVAWMSTEENDIPLVPVNLIFRVRRLRKNKAKKISDTLVCPVENGVVYRIPMTCESCKICWRDPK